MNRQQFTIQVMSLIKGMPIRIKFRKSYDDKMYKAEGGSRKKNALQNPFYGRVEIVETWAGYCVGVNYTNGVTNAAVRSGNTQVTKADVMASLKSNWHKPCEGKLGEFFSTDKASESKLYINLNYNAKQVAKRVDIVYYLDGKLASEAEIKAIKAWDKPYKEPKMSSTQLEQGVNEENRQFFICVSVDNIISITQGDKVVEGLWTPTLIG